jgi:hypothetical protein
VTQHQLTLNKRTPKTFERTSRHLFGPGTLSWYQDPSGAGGQGHVAGVHDHGTPVLVPGSQWSGWSRSGIHSRLFEIPIPPGFFITGHVYHLPVCTRLKTTGLRFIRRRNPPRKTLYQNRIIQSIIVHHLNDSKTSRCS